MSRDLQQLLRDTAVQPTEPVAPAELVGRARRRRRRRHVAAGAGSLAMAALAAAVLLGLGVTDPQPPEIVDQPPAPPEPGPEPDDDGEVEAEGGDADDGEPDGDAAPVTVALAKVERALLAYGPEGIRKVGDGQDRRIWGSPVAAALPDLRGGVVLQFVAPDDPAGRERIEWLPAGADAPGVALASDQQESVLHAVVEFDGEPTVLFTRRTGEGEDEVETLYAHGLDSGTERELGITGRLESGLGGVGLVDDRLVVSRCHLQCQLVIVPPGAAPEGDDGEELLPGPASIQGLDVHDGVAAYIELPPAGIDRDDTDGPVLWLHDLYSGDRHDLPLPTPDLDLDATRVTVDLATDSNAALIAFHRWDDLTRAQTLLVDRLDDQPRHRWLGTHEHVRFDIPDPDSG